MTVNRVVVKRAANGHIWIATEAKEEARRIGRLLIFRHGFWRWGRSFPRITDEEIFPTYRRFGLKILAGRDNWVGFDFLSANDATDIFLLKFVRRHLPDAEITAVSRVPN